MAHDHPFLAVSLTCNMSKVQKMRDRLAHIADKSREEFETKKKELEEEMSKGRVNIGKIQKGLKNNEIIEQSHIGLDPLESPAKKTQSHTKGTKKMAASSLTGSGGITPFSVDPLVYMPTGLRVSEWCFTGKLDSTPPIVKANGVYENIRLLGRGSFGDVYLVKNVDDNKL